jgi:hypothetical protein
MGDSIWRWPMCWRCYFFCHAGQQCQIPSPARTIGCSRSRLFSLSPEISPFIHPFFGAGWVLIIAIGGALLISLMLETSLVGRFPPATFWFGVSAVCTRGGLLFWLGARRDLSVTIEPETDLRHLVLLASMWCSGAEERKPFAFHGASGV